VLHHGRRRVLHPAEEARVSLFEHGTMVPVSDGALLVFVALIVVVLWGTYQRGKAAGIQRAQDVLGDRLR